jgi:hypothetical protein
MAFMRRPYLIASLATHAALLALLYYYGAYEPRIAAQERQLGESRLLDRHAEMRRHVADMEQIEALMRASEGKEDAAAPETVRFDATTAESPDELLARAEALSKKIDAMGEQARVDDYARITGQDKDKAAAQLEASAPAPQPEAQAWPAPPEEQASASAQATAQSPDASAGAASASGKAGSSSGVSGAATEARIEALERHARDVLAQRQRQMERAGQGVRVDGAQPGIAGRIASFIRGGTSGASTGSYWGSGDFFDHGAGRIPTVDRAAMRKGKGHKLGPGGEYANRVYVNNWYLIGPFPGKHGRDMFATDSFAPERAVVLDAAYRGKDGRVLTWRHIEAPAYPLMPPDMAEDSVYYGYTELMMDGDRDLAMWIGADDDAQVWINDRLEWKGGNVNKLSFFQKVYDDWNGYAAAYNMNEGKVTVHFRKGRNKVFFKLSNGPNQAFFSMVLTPP